MILGKWYLPAQNFVNQHSKLMAIQQNTQMVVILWIEGFWAHPSSGKSQVSLDVLGSTWKTENCMGLAGPP